MILNQLLNQKVFFFVAFILLFISGCTFDLFDNKEDYLPVVEISSIEPKYDGTLLTFIVIEEGTSPMEYMGICYDTTENPALTANQMLFNGNIGNFELFIENLTPKKLYYFKAFAANGNLYSVSKTVEYKVPLPGAPYIPCLVSDNKVFYNGADIGYFSVYSGKEYSSVGYYGVETSGSWDYPGISFSFHKIPTNGKYFTCSSTIDFDSDGKNRLVYTKIRQGFDWFHTGWDTLYIENNNNDTIIISFCNLSYIKDNTTQKLEGRIIVKK